MKKNKVIIRCLQVSGLVLLVCSGVLFFFSSNININLKALKLLKDEPVYLPNQEGQKSNNSALTLLYYQQTKNPKYILELIRVRPSYLYTFYEDDSVDPLIIFPTIPKNINTALTFSNIGSKLVSSSDKKLSKKGLIFLYLARKISNHTTVSNELVFALNWVFKEYSKSRYLLMLMVKEKNNNFKVLLNLADLNREMKNYSMALSYLEICRRIDPENERYLLLLASVFIQLGRYEESNSCLDQIKRTSPKTPSTYYQMAEIYIRLNQISKAESELLYSIAIDKTYLPRYYYGVFLFQTGEFQRAVIQLTLASTLNPDFVNIFSYRSLCYERLLKYELAISDMNRCLLLEPENKDFQNRKKRLETLIEK
jgi:tetratricopeptide (TPR) repeat protein